MTSTAPSLASNSSDLELSADRLDMLAETFNMALGEATAMFADLMGEEIEMSVPTVELIDKQELIRLLRTIAADEANSNLCGVRQDFDAPSLLQTRATVVFAERGALEIVRHMLGDVTAIEQITELEQDALSEIGNIIINGCMSSLFNLFKRELSGSLPTVVRAKPHELFDAQDMAEQVLVARIRMSLSSKDVQGYVILTMNVGSISNFIREVEGVFGLEQA